MSAEFELTVLDKTTSQLVSPERVLKLLFGQKTITVGDIIKARVRIEFQGAIDNNGDLESALVRLSNKVNSQLKNESYNAEEVLNRQIETALRAFESNEYFVIIGDSQVISLTEEIDLTNEFEVSFFRLVPLVGG